MFGLTKIVCDATSKHQSGYFVEFEDACRHLIICSFSLSFTGTDCSTVSSVKMIGESGLDSLPRLSYQLLREESIRSISNRYWIVRIVDHPTFSIVVNVDFIWLSKQLPMPKVRKTCSPHLKPVQYTLVYSWQCEYLERHEEALPYMFL